MSTYKYKSDSIYRDVVMKSYVIGWFGALGVVVVTAVTLIFLYSGSCWQEYRLALVLLPAVHTVAWLIIANLMCATFQGMANQELRQSPPPTPDDESREIPISKGGKNGRVTWE